MDEESSTPVESQPEGFPMSLREFAATTRLDPLWEAGLSVYVPASERTLQDWQRLLEEFKVRPVTT